MVVRAVQQIETHRFDVVGDLLRTHEALEGAVELTTVADRGLEVPKRHVRVTDQLDRTLKSRVGECQRGAHVDEIADAGQRKRLRDLRGELADRIQDRATPDGLSERRPPVPHHECRHYCPTNDQPDRHRDPT
jgi:hypothetical protein